MVIQAAAGQCTNINKTHDYLDLKMRLEPRIYTECQQQTRKPLQGDNNKLDASLYLCVVPAATVVFIHDDSSPKLQEFAYC
jgi:hypothetical protein